MPGYAGTALACSRTDLELTELSPPYRFRRSACPERMRIGPRSAPDAAAGTLLPEVRNSCDHRRHLRTCGVAELRARD